MGTGFGSTVLSEGSWFSECGGCVERERETNEIVRKNYYPRETRGSAIEVLERESHEEENEVWIFFLKSPLFSHLNASIYTPFH